MFGGWDKPKAMAQEKITFYKRWGDSAKELSDEERLELYDAVVQYAFEGSIKEFVSPLARVSFNFIKHEIDEDNIKRNAISEKRKMAGKAGGRPRNVMEEQPKEVPPQPIPAAPQQGELFDDVEQVQPKKKTAKGTKPKKRKYAELVLLTEDEYQKLTEIHGEDAAKWMIAKLDDYKGASGKPYKSDYRAILNWVVGEYEKKGIYETAKDIKPNTGSAITAKERRDAEFAEYIAQKLSD